jgi:hypothetical protein
MEHCRVSVGPFTQYYVVDLLANRVLRGDIEPGATLADRYARALQADRHVRFRILREVGDIALVSCSLWSDVPGDRYQITMGSKAYARLAAMPDGLGEYAPEVFAELADRFRDLVDALIRMGTLQSLCSARDVLRLYEQWQETRSGYVARVLAERGIYVGSSGSLTPS